MDTTKWRTVAIRIEDFHLLKGLCEKTYRNPAAMIGKLVNEYIILQSKKEQIQSDTCYSLCGNQIGSFQAPQQVSRSLSEAKRLPSK